MSPDSRAGAGPARRRRAGRGLAGARSGYAPGMAPYDDDDDWVGTPPEGRYSRDRAKPEYWRNRWPLAGAGLVVVVLLLIIVIILH